MMHSSTPHAAAVPLTTAQTWKFEVSHVLGGEVQKQEPVRGGAGGPRQ